MRVRVKLDILHFWNLQLSDYELITFDYIKIISSSIADMRKGSYTPWGQSFKQTWARRNTCDNSLNL